jgi:hypothetical protein
MVDHLSNTAITVKYILLEDMVGGTSCLGTFFWQASENQQFGCIFVVSDSEYEAAT